MKEFIINFLFVSSKYFVILASDFVTRLPINTSYMIFFIVIFLSIVTPKSFALVDSGIVLF